MTWFPETIANRDLYLVDYAKLFLDVVREQWMVEQSAGEGADAGTEADAGNAVDAGGAVGGVPFVTSSPSRGPLTEQPYVQRWGAAQSNDYGDIHYYNYASDCADVNLLPRPRFVSEFGFQSLPSLHTLRRQLDAAAGDLRWNSSELQRRQRHAGGYEEMAAQAALHFRLPDASDSDLDRDLGPAGLLELERWVFLSQAVQGLCYRTALAHWRRIKDSVPGRTMGAIYWQLNDVWAGPTWSGVEYGGRWKAVQYEVKRVFAPVVVSGFYNATTGVAAAFLTSDLDATLRGVMHLNVSRWDADGGAGAGTWRAPDVPFELGPLQSRQVWSASVAALYAAAGCPAPEHCYIALGATVDSVQPTPGGGLARQQTRVVVPRAEIFPRPLRLAPLRVPSFTFSDFAPAQCAEAEDQTGDDSDADADADAGAHSDAIDSDTPLLSASFSLATDVAAAGVFLSTALEGRFDDNSFVMDAGQRRALTFSVPAAGPDGPPPTPFTLAQLRDSLRVMSLRDVYTDESSGPVSSESAAAARDPPVDLAAAAARSAPVQLRGGSALFRLDDTEEIDSFALLTE